MISCSESATAVRSALGCLLLLLPIVVAAAKGTCACVAAPALLPSAPLCLALISLCLTAGNCGKSIVVLLAQKPFDSFNFTDHQTSSALIHSPTAAF